MTDYSRGHKALGDAITAKILDLPQDEATKSRDYGRGYAQACRDVVDLIERMFSATPVE